MELWIEQGNWTLAAILCLSLIGWFVGCMKWLDLREKLRGEFSHVAEIAQSRVAVGLELSSRQRHEIIHHETIELRQGLTLLASVSMALPLLGLLGTVLGMMKTFSALTEQGAMQSATLMSRGISEALITTQAGLIAAVPIILLHGILSSRIRQGMSQCALILKKMTESHV